MVATLPDESGAVALVQHVGIADRLIDSPRTGRQVRERVPFPGVRIVILGIGEGVAGMFDDPHGGAGIGERRFRILHLWRTPPLDHMRPRPPQAHQREIARVKGRKR